MFLGQSVISPKKKLENFTAKFVINSHLKKKKKKGKWVILLLTKNIYTINATSQQKQTDNISCCKHLSSNRN